MKLYLELMRHVLEHGEDRRDRTGTGTRSIFGYQMRFNLQEGFPLVTTKRCHVKSVVEELLWFLRGETNIRSLKEKGVRIWDEWADENGELGPIYGRQWRAWKTPEGPYDQIQRVCEQLRKDPYSRRHLVSAWNCGELHEMALPPCHTLYQFYVSTRGQLSCQLYQRSCDIFLGLPFNLASYALLTHLIAQHVGLSVGEFVWTGGDVHLYQNHFAQAREQLSRTPRPLPQLELDPVPTLEAYTRAQIRILNYDPHPRLVAPISV